MHPMSEKKKARLLAEAQAFAKRLREGWKQTMLCVHGHFQVRTELIDDTGVVVYEPCSLCANGGS